MKLRLSTLWTTAGIVVVLLVLLRVPILSALGSYLVLSETPRKADLVLVLAGGLDGQRILTAGSLVKNGYAPVALVSGPAGTYGLHECDLAIPFAIRSGFPESYFAHVENEAHSTAEEAQAIIPELRRRGARSVLLVTSNFHTRRAASLFRAAAPDLNFVPIAAPDLYFNPNTWWHTREGEKIFVTEWEKTVAVWAGL